jgi:DNA modification methylase
MLNKPSDIGFEMAGYNLPPLEIVDCKIETPSLGKDLFNDMAISATDFNQELRRTITQRMEKTAEIVNSSDESFIVWIKHDAEGDMLKKMIKGAIEVRGSDDIVIKKQRLLGFAKNEFRVLITKTKIAQFGLNYQNCHNQVFASLDFSFEGLYQAMRRSYRFGQKQAVKIYIITTDTMGNVSRSIKQKQDNFIVMQNEMADAINANLGGRMMNTEQFDTDDVITQQYHIRRGDCVRLIKDVPDNSVGFSVFSPPFADLFVYSSHVEDMGNCKDDEQFEKQFGFLASELYRVIKEGRNVAVHCMDLPSQKGRHGYIGLRDFTGLILRLFESVGFVYASRITIWKDPVTAMQRTKALGLLHKQIKKDATMSRVGIPDTILVFRKDGERYDPVAHYGSYQDMINAVRENPDLDKAIEGTRILDVETWQKYASPIWMDIDQSDTLNGRIARENEDEKHLCPLQLPVIKRLVHLYSNPGDTVLTPFLGIGSELYQSIVMGRKGIGFELKESYYDQAKKNLSIAVANSSQGDLFE